MNAEQKVKQVYPEALCDTERLARQKIRRSIFSSLVGERISTKWSRESQAWADAWRRIQQRNSGKKEE